ncbi:MAG: maltooligosyltrehalose trehalohydrolase [Thermoanaerobaculia bacterium]|nr:maltooligosyltrehalose trehalohydrolase [Thermoanaerobaculia bacterium]
MTQLAEETAILTELTPPLGAIVRSDGLCEFRVWAPQVEKVELHIVAPRDRRVALTKNNRGYHEALVDAGAGTRYFFVINGRERPDPASRSQPDGVHQASEAVASEFVWHDAGWDGVALADYVIYELHVGTFTDEGTFDSVIAHLDALKDLGVTAVELMPIGQFPGTRNWGYDGVYIGAAQTSYGGAQGLKRLVDACHARGLALLLDVVYNHLGPEGNYLAEYGPYFTDRYKTPWGLALNFDGPHSDDVRWFFIHNALQWIDEFHIDGLRVDAVHAIADRTAEPFLQDLTSAVSTRGARLGRRVYTFAESNLNDPRVITPKEELGLGFDSQWCDDFHHSLRTLLTGDTSGYYAGYGRTSDLARTWTSGYLYTGQHSVYRGRKYGLAPKTRDGRQFVVFSQNHDQVGNRMTGDRLAATVSLEKVRLAAAAVILSPFLPMLFMGEEYGETAPFQYFTSHADPDLIESVRLGRHKEFDSFRWAGEPPDPHDAETFLRSKLRREELDGIRALYKELLRLRASTPALRTLDLDAVETHADDEERTLLIKRGDVLIAFNFSDARRAIELPFGDVAWSAMIETGGRVEGNAISMPAQSFAVFHQNR